MTVYDRIKLMSMEEMKVFMYWVYVCGNKDGENGLMDSPDGYFGGYFLGLHADEVIPSDNIDNIWDT